MGTLLLLRPQSHPARKQQYYTNNCSEIWNLRNLAMSAVLEWGMTVPGRHLQEPFLPHPRPSWAVTKQGLITGLGLAQGLFWGSDSNTPDMKQQSPVMRFWHILLPQALLSSIPQSIWFSFCLVPVDHTPARFVPSQGLGKSMTFSK